MIKEKIIFNTIFYIILTLFFIILAIKEKDIGDFIRRKRDIFSDLLIDRLNIQKPMIQNGLKKTVNFVETIGSALILVLIIQYFYLGNFLVPTGSMEPTIMPGNRLFGDMISYKFKKPNRGDIIVFKEPMKNRYRYTKRLIGLPGERIEIENNSIYIYGDKLEGKNFRWNYKDMGLIENKEWKIPEKGDKIKLINAEFVIGDEEYSFKELKEYIKNGNWFENIYAKKLKFKIDGKKYNEGLSSYITEQKHYERLLMGNKIDVNGREIEIVSGTFYISKGSIDANELNNMLENNPDILKGEIRITECKFLLNGKYETGPIMDRKILKKLISGKEVELENNYYMALGDNSANSLDSRYWGFVKDERIMGRPFFRFWPITKMGLLK